MTTSVNTNIAAMIALQNLTQTNDELKQTQNRINTGLTVATAKDNGAIFAIAQNMRSDVAAFNAVRQSLDRAQSTADVALNAGSVISDILIQMKEKALSASDASLDANSRAALNTDFVALRDQITTIVSNATFNGVNLVNGSTTAIRALANASGTARITVTGRNLSLSGSIVTITTTGNISTRANASTMIGTVNQTLANVNAALAQLGTDSKKVEMHQRFVVKLQDSLTGGIGNLVDADLAAESARLQALQVKQQLGIQALGIANSAPQTLLQLFQGR